MRCAEDHASGKPLVSLSVLYTDTSALGTLLV